MDVQDTTTSRGMMNTPSYVFRVDASIDIGTGHVMRCLTLADALKINGAICRFICRVHVGNLIGLIQKRGYEVLKLDSAPERVKRQRPNSTEPTHSDWLGVEWVTDAEQSLALLANSEKVNWLIIDHYSLDVRWQQHMREACNNIMVIDDLADRRHDCDLLLDQNLGHTTDNYYSLVPKKCEMLIGPKYALLRPEFAVLRDYSLSRRKEPQLKNILISMGGIDKDNATGKVLDSLRQISLVDGCKINVVMGGSAPWLPQVKELAIEMPWPTEILVDVNNMAELMADSDLAIGAAGSTSWERCVVGLPTWMVVLAANQRDVAKLLAQAGAAELLSLNSQDMVSFFKKRVESVAITEILKIMSVKASEICQGYGTKAVCQKIMDI